MVCNTDCLYVSIYADDVEVSHLSELAKCNGLRGRILTWKVDRYVHRSLYQSPAPNNDIVASEIRGLDMAACACGLLESR